MDIARQKRDENIAEYVLYIWQLEDLLRAMRFDRKVIFDTLVAPREATDEWRLAALDWYMEIADLLTREGKAESGHLDHTLHLIGEMNDLHLTLIEQPSGRAYRELFARLAPSLPGLRATLGRADVSDIELAFRALYAAMLYKMKGTHAEISAEVLELVSPVVALLADTYHKVERGEIDIYRDNA
jgi:flagellin-specific chaperone FliS